MQKPPRQSDSVGDPTASIPTTAASRAWAEARLVDLGASGPPRWSALPVEASNRRFFRVAASDVRAPAASFILMTSPPALESNEQFLRLAALFGRHGIGVPTVYACDEGEGWFLLEDLGVRHLSDAYATPDREVALAGALDTLLALQGVHDPVVPRYTAIRFGDELRIFTDWFVEGLLAEPCDTAVTSAVFERLVENTQAQPQCCVHRDFHCRNLLQRPDGRIGVVDFQDALIGPASYDLASLLRDCYYVFEEAEIARWRDVYLERSALPLDPAVFSRQFDLTAVQRQLKAVGIFARLKERDGKSSHLPWILPVLARVLRIAGSYPELAPLAAWLRHLQPLAAQKLGRHRVMAMILAAGRGERLRPLSDRLPKALAPVAGQPLLAHQLRWLAGAGFRDVVINLHHLGDQIESAFGDGSLSGVRIRYSREAERLETGGGIVQALPLLGDAPFLVLNGDIYTDLPLRGLRDALPVDADAHLVLTPTPPARTTGDFEFAAGRVTARGGTYVYCGIAVLRPALFAGRVVESFSLRELLFAALTGGRLSGEVWSGFWSDIGTPDQLAAVDAYARAHPALL